MVLINVGHFADNVTEEIMNEVVTDQEHHSVKDLVAMIEKNTVTESANPYVRKWGCDLISPEPHTRNVTYRREKRDYPRLQSKKTYNWVPQKDKFDHNGNDQGREGSLDNDFRLSAHVTEIDDLLGRPPQEFMMTFDNHGKKEKAVAWPPPLNKSDSTDTRNTTDFDRQSSMSSYTSQRTAQQDQQRNLDSSRKMAKKAMDDLDIQIENMQDTFDRQINSMKNTGYNVSAAKPAVKSEYGNRGLSFLFIGKLYEIRIIIFIYVILCKLL